MPALPSLDPSSCERLGWTLVHFAWQGVALAVLLWGVLAVMRLRGARPRVRYVVCCACLAAMALAPLVSYALIDASVYDPGPLQLPPPTVTGSAGGAIASSPVVASQTRVQQVSLWVRSRVQRYAAPAVATWAVAVCCLGVWQLLRLALLRRSVGVTSSDLPATWDHLHSIPAKVGVKYPVSIVVSTLVDAPATVGWLKPIVLMPASILTGLSRDVVEALIAHELAHIRRWDYLVNLLQAALETLLWWHPAVWWVSGRVRDEREHCCDELAAVVSGGRVKYAKALTALEDLRIRTPQFAMGSQGGSLVARVSRLVGGPVPAHSRRRGGPAAVFVAVGLATLLAARLSSSAASTPPTRGIDQVQSLCAAVYEILEVRPPADGNDRLWLAKLDAVVGQPKGDGRRDAEDALVDAILTHSAPDHLRTEILARVQLGARFAYERVPDWTHGAYLNRVTLANTLWDNAKSLHAGGNVDRGVAYARAAVLLGAQETSVSGSARLHGLFKDRMFGQLAGLKDWQTIELQRHVEDHDKLNSALYERRAEADAAIAELMKLVSIGASHRDMTASASSTNAQPTMAVSEPAAIAALEGRAITAIEDMIAVSRDRPDLEWHVASSAAQFFAVRPSPAGRSAAQWAQTWATRLPGEAHFARWLTEAAENPLRVKPAAATDGKQFWHAKP